MAGSGTMATLSGRRILLVMSGGIAVYKSLDLIRRGEQAAHPLRAPLWVAVVALALIALALW